ncbi:MAG: hypothetical protein E7259_08665 [Lachnospiraceae bacterium]|nr:hypothetical protein [Lachnospiraceae bacterium]
MNKPWSEAEKNFIKCAVLMLIAGISMVVIGESGWGIFSIVAGVAFAIIGVYMHKTRDGEPKQVSIAPKKSISEIAKGKSEE